MANQNQRYRGWCPSNDYQVHEVMEPALRKRFDRPTSRHKKGHVAFKYNIEEAINVVETIPSPEPEPAAKTETETPTTNHANAYESVDQKADTFIKQQHRRIELARLKSLGAA
ncbi:uncharacterized protein LOC113851336 [Abrus precatorius]|uniref:Uncharacterized protein LOC113851336 n=1 Tax=Abrus precatorius TaxID=3816 RepID=A0A8B8K1L0_ABRPR|nr:uncharacterized protein LOC113851336 [Abrus precatorius]